VRKNTQIARHHPRGGRSKRELITLDYEIKHLGVPAFAPARAQKVVSITKLPDYQITKLQKFRLSRARAPAPHTPYLLSFLSIPECDFVEEFLS